MGKAAWFVLCLFAAQFNWSQEIDSLQIIRPTDTIPIAIDLDTIPKQELDTLAQVKVLDSLAPAQALDTVPSDSLKVPDMIYIERSLLDSLLSPYYNITLDSINQDSIFNFTLGPSSG